MTTTDDFSEIFAKTPGRIKPGLERMNAALAQLGAPHREGKNLLVAGTNGKGTTSSFLWYLCSLSSNTVSLFSSPHLVQFRERYLFSGAKISHRQLKEQLTQLQAELGPAYEPLSFFEVATLLGFRLFAELGATERIWEVGLGGRWDCTNTVEPDVSVVVSIGLDHQEFLGDTLEQVLREKLGVARPGKPLLLGSCPNLASEPLRRLCAEATDQLLCFGEHFGRRKEGRGKEGRTGKEGFLALPGRPRQTFPLPEPLLAKPDYLIDNFILALAAFQQWRGPSAATAEDLIAAINWEHLWALPGFFGRSQQLSIGSRPVLWDVCHNAAGARAFAAGIAKLFPATGGKPRPTGLVSILADKDIKAILAELEPVIDVKAFYRIDHPRSPQKQAIENLPLGISVFDSFAEAWNSVESWWPSSGPESGAAPLVICGSVMAIGAAMAHLAEDSVEIKNLWHFDRFIRS